MPRTYSTAEWSLNKNKYQKDLLEITLTPPSHSLERASVFFNQPPHSSKNKINQPTAKKHYVCPYVAVIKVKNHKHALHTLQRHVGIYCA